MLCQFVYTILVLLPCYLFFQSELACFAFLVFVGTASIWNGAGYYFEGSVVLWFALNVVVFSARYTLQLQEADKKLSEQLER
jgi:hypothetical protein